MRLNPAAVEFRLELAETSLPLPEGEGWGEGVSI